MSGFRLARYALPVFLAAAAGCDGFLAPSDAELAREGTLTFIPVSEDAPPLNATEVSFWIVRGEAREVEISYLGDDGYNGKCIRLVVPADAPLRHPDGTVFAEGDSVQVTVRVVDSSLFVFDFEPVGLQFNPANPARLEIRYRWMDEDVNGDGIVDESDAAVASRAAVWRQESPGGSWSRLQSFRDPGIQEVHANLTRFTRYAFASD